MALSNKFGSLLLTTGNKSEISVGYCTLYGDMNGGLAVIADLPKMMVYRVSRWRNRRKPDIPECDSDQGALRGAASESDRSGQPAALRSAGPDSGAAHRAVPVRRRHHRAAASIENTVRRVLRLVRMAEFKRKQAAPVLKVTSRAFGTGWRMPIVRQE